MTLSAYVEKDSGGNVIGVTLSDGSTFIPLRAPDVLQKAVIGSDRILELYFRVDNVDTFEQLALTTEETE